MEKTTFEEITDGYETFMEEWANEHHRFRSYDPCKKYFDDHYGKDMTDEEAKKVYDECALRLFYYLASWGMFRNNDWLIWKSYKVFVPVVIELFNDKYKGLWNIEPYTYESSQKYVDEVMVLYDAVYEILSNTLKEDDKEYPPEKPKENKVTRLMVCKILMGTYGCVIAYDSYDVKAMRAIHVTVPSIMNSKLLKNTYKIIVDNAEEFKKIKTKIKTDYKTDYTAFKILDMILWEYGKKLGGK